MEGTYILGTNSSLNWISESGLQFIQLPESDNEQRVHDFIVDSFKDKTVDKLIVSLDDQPNIGLAAALHFRLMPDQIGKKCLAHIIFVFSDDLSSYLKYGDSSQLFLTNGVSYCSGDELKYVINAANSINPSDYINQFVKHIHITPAANIGRHSLANQWGASVLGEMITNGVIPENAEIQNASKTLYFKYTAIKERRKEELFGDENTAGTKNICLRSSGKKILLIDDEADRGWSYVLKSYFSIAQRFDVINHPMEDEYDLTDDEIQMLENNDYDLILLDLRLNGYSEENNVNVKNFSGWKILDMIKQYNEGIQVIIFTASNKAWNIKGLLDAGADGYYIKESPEFHSKNFSEDNYRSFKDTVDKCLSRGYLRSMVKDIDDVKNKSFNIPPNDKCALIKQLEMGYSMLSLASKADSPQSASAKKMFAYAYVSFFSCIETITKAYIDDSQNGLKFISDNTNVPEWIIEQNTIRCASSQAKRGEFSIAQKIVAIYRKKNISLAYNQAKELANITRLRNNFIHDVSKQIVFSTIATEPIDTDKGCLQIFEKVKTVIRDLG